MAALDTLRMLGATLIVMGSLIALGPSDAGRAAQKVLKSAEVERVTTSALPDGKLWIREGSIGEPRFVGVTGTETTYKCSTLLIEDGRARPEWSGYLYCLEVRASDPNVTYSWCIWAHDPLWNARLFTDVQARNYLAWVDGSSVCFREVSEPKDKVVELTKRLSTGPEANVGAVPVSGLLPEVFTWGRNALYADIRITSLTRNDGGSFELKISDPEGTKSYTIVGQGDQWRLADPEAKGKPEAAKPEAIAPQAAQPQHKAQAPKEPGQ